MVTGGVAAAAVAAVLVVAVVLARLASARSQRRFETVVGQLDLHMEAISQNLQRAVERSDDARGRGLGDLGLTLDLRELLQRLAEEAATPTGAQAATGRGRGGGLPIRARGSDRGGRRRDGRARRVRARRRGVSPRARAGAPGSGRRCGAWDLQRAPLRRSR